MKKIVTGVLFAGLALACSGTKSAATDTTVSMLKSLGARWTLQSLGGNTDINSLFGSKIPSLQFDPATMRVSGNNGCNNITGSFALSDNKNLNLGQLASTKMFCPGNGESTFMTALNKVNQLKINGNVLTLLDGTNEIMSLIK